MTDRCTGCGHVEAWCVCPRPEPPPAPEQRPAPPGPKQRTLSQHAKAELKLARQAVAEKGNRWV